VPQKGSESAKRIVGFLSSGRPPRLPVWADWETITSRRNACRNANTGHSFDESAVAVPIHVLSEATSDIARIDTNEIPDGMSKDALKGAVICLGQVLPFSF
jgi:hypothetical protein